jgi:hypothetical protein
MASTQSRKPELVEEELQQCYFQIEAFLAEDCLAEVKELLTRRDPDIWHPFFVE